MPEKPALRERSRHANPFLFLFNRHDKRLQVVIIVTQVNGAEVLDGGGEPLRRQGEKLQRAVGDGKKSDIEVHVQQKGKGTQCGGIAWRIQREQQRESPP